MIRTHLIIDGRPFPIHLGKINRSAAHELIELFKEMEPFFLPGDRIQNRIHRFRSASIKKFPALEEYLEIRIGMTKLQNGVAKNE